MKFLKKLLLTECTLLLLIQGSWAHAFVDHTEPAVGSQIHSVPSQVKIWFTEKLEPAFSRSRYSITLVERSIGVM